MPSSSTVLEQYLDQHDDRAWHRTAGLLEAETHEVDRTAVRIWLSFFPIAECGYIDTGATHPLIRLACQARATGAVSIVIPPWTGVIGGAVVRQARRQPAIDGAR